jgi:DivIVA domain-containing protein
LSLDANEFPTAMRGYEREAVDEALRLLRKELLQVNALNSQLAGELREKAQLASELQARLNESEAPNYASVGTRAALILSTAEEQSMRIVADAEAERVRILNDLEGELASLREEAKEYYDSLVSEAQRRSERLQTQAKAEFDEILKDAQSRAAMLVDEATREAGSIRGNVHRGSQASCHRQA